MYVDLHLWTVNTFNSCEQRRVRRVKSGTSLHLFLHCAKRHCAHKTLYLVKSLLSKKGANNIWKKTQLDPLPNLVTWQTTRCMQIQLYGQWIASPEDTKKGWQVKHLTSPFPCVTQCRLLLSSWIVHKMAPYKHCPCRTSLRWAVTSADVAMMSGRNAAWWGIMGHLQRA